MEYASITVETTLIGEMLIKSEIIPDVIQVLEPNDFMTPEIRQVYSIIFDLFKKGEKIDPLVIALKSDDTENCKIFLWQCAEAVTSTANYKTHINLIKDESKRQKALKNTNELIEMLNDDTDIEECRKQTGEIIKSFDDITDNEAIDVINGFCNFTEGLSKCKDYYRTGTSKIDEYTRISKSDYVIVGGRPSSGKTALTLQMMLNMAKTHRVVYFSLETSSEKIFDRLVSNYTHTSMRIIKDGFPEPSKNESPDEKKNREQEEMEIRTHIASYSDDFCKLNLFVVPAAGWTVEKIKAKALQLKAEIVFVDYLGLIRSDGNSQYERATRISMDLHTMAQKFKFTVIALVQLNRVQGEPTMASLRDSGQIEQDADIILFLHGEEKDKDNGDRKLIIAKNKEGKCGAVDLKFDGDTQHFMEVVNYEQMAAV